MSLSEMIAGSAVAAVISNPRLADNPIIECNDAFVRLTGYARHEILGRNCRFMSGAGTEPGLTELIRQGIRKRQPTLVEILNYRRNGDAFRNAVLVAPVFDEEGAVEFFLGSQMEVGTGHRGDGMRATLARSALAKLTPRQGAVLTAMAAGRLNKQIACSLGISERTVKMHRSAMLRALGIATAAEAIRLAVEAELHPLNEL